MAKILIKKLQMTDFKGQPEKTADFSGRSIVVSGKNGSGKTTMADSWYWTMADKDYSLKNSPEIRPDDDRNCVPRVDFELSIDGKPVNISKYQKKSVSKPKSDGSVRTAISNKYEINGVEKTERAFTEEFLNRGIDLSMFLMLSHLDYFTSLKTQDMRNIVLNMAKSRSDLEIAESLSDCEDVARMLWDYRLDEIESMNKAKKKNADKRLEEIPNQIKGLELAKVDIDTAELELQKNALQEQIKEIQNEMDAISDNSAVNKLISKISTINLKMKELQEKEQKKVDEKISEKNDEYTNIISRKTEIEHQLYELRMDLKHSESCITRSAVDLQDARGRYKTVNDSQYDDSEIKAIESKTFSDELSVCPTCGQLLPDEQLKVAKERFETSKSMRLEQAIKEKEYWYERKENQLKAIISDGNAAKESLERSNAIKAKTESSIKDLESQLEELIKEADLKSAEIRNLPTKVEMEGNAEFQNFKSEIAALNEKLKLIPSVAERKNEYRVLLENKRKELTDVEKEIARSENNVQIDEQIEALNKAMRENAQRSTDADKILYQLKQVSMQKNNLLLDEINSYFNGVKVQLFTYRANGDVADACDWLVWDEQQRKWTKLIGCANTALTIKGKLAIINGLQKYFGVSYPVFVDYAAELDDSNLEKIKTDFQCIFLKVDNSELSVKFL